MAWLVAMKQEKADMHQENAEMRQEKAAKRTKGKVFEDSNKLHQRMSEGKKPDDGIPTAGSSNDSESVEPKWTVVKRSKKRDKRKKPSDRSRPDSLLVRTADMT